jgi:hypothetical protein
VRPRETLPRKGGTHGADSAVDFRKRRIEVKTLHMLFVEPRSRRLLHKPEGGVWTLNQLGPLA